MHRYRHTGCTIRRTHRLNKKTKAMFFKLCGVLHFLGTNCSGHKVLEPNQSRATLPPTKLRPWSTTRPDRARKLAGQQAPCVRSPTNGDGGGSLFPTEAPTVGACDAVRSPPLSFICISLSGLCVWHFSLACFCSRQSHLREMCWHLALMFVGTGLGKKVGLTAHA